MGGNEGVVLWNVGEATGCLLLPGISISSNLSADEKGVGVSNLVWSCRSREMMEIPAGLLTKAPL